jgi:hypothetical protein
VDEDRSDWFDLVGDFVDAYAPEGIEEPESSSSAHEARGGGGHGAHRVVRAHLVALDVLLDTYPEMRLG